MQKSTLRLLLSLLALPSTSAADARADAGSTNLCDSAWPKRHWYFNTGKVRVLVAETNTTIDGVNPNAAPEPVIEYDPRRPLAIYDVTYNRSVPRNFPDKVNRAVGRFPTKEAALAAKQEVWNAQQPPHLMPIQTSLFSPQESFTCKVVMTVRNDKVYWGADWMVEAAGALFFGQNGACKNGKMTKTIVALGCDGEKLLFSDKITVDCSSDVTTCLHPIRSGAIVIEHSYSEEEGGTQLGVRTWDIKKKKRVHNLDWGHDGGPDTELLAVKDMDGDGLPELTFTRADADQPHKIMRWNGKTFAASKK